MNTRNRNLQGVRLPFTPTVKGDGDYVITNIGKYPDRHRIADLPDPDGLPHWSTIIIVGFGLVAAAAFTALLIF